MKIADDVLKVLSTAVAVPQPDRLVIRGRLLRKDYAAVNKVLMEMGGKWNRGAQAHVFPAGDAADQLDQVLVAGEITTHQELGFFETPDDVVREMLFAATIKPAMTVLEPSAGKGRIARAVAAKVGKLLVNCVEIDRRRADSLTLDGFATLCADFLAMNPDLRISRGSNRIARRYDRIVMNPPFARRADVIHVEHALKFLHPYGRLVAIMSAGVQYRDDALTRAFRAKVDERGGTIIPVWDGAFKSSGTNVRTVLVVVG